MNIESFILKNAKGERIVGLIERVEHPKGTAVIQHGLGGSKEQPQIRAMAQSCLKAGWQTITFDSRHAFGESDGDISQVTATTYCEDIETVITQLVLSDQKLILIGHSLGGAGVLNYTCRHPDTVFAVAPIASVLTYDLYLIKSLRSDPVFLQKWQQDGRYLKVSNSSPGRQGYISWAMVEDLKHFPLLDSIPALTMPILCVVGEQDQSTPPDQQKMLYDMWQGPKELHVLSDCDHIFTRPESLEQLADRLGKWLTKLAPNTDS